MGTGQDTPYTEFTSHFKSEEGKCRHNDRKWAQIQETGAQRRQHFVLLGW